MTFVKPLEPTSPVSLVEVPFPTEIPSPTEANHRVLEERVSCVPFQPDLVFFFVWFRCPQAQEVPVDFVPTCRPEREVEVEPPEIFPPPAQECDVVCVSL